MKTWPAEKVLRFNAFMTFVFAIAKGVVGLLTGSLSLLASALDSWLDMSVSLLNYFGFRWARRAPTHSFRFGFSKVEGVLSVVQGLVVMGSAIGLLFIAFQRLQSPALPQKLWLVSIVIGVVIVLTLGLMWLLKQTLKHSNSMIVRNELLHHRSDVLHELALLGGTGIMILTQDPLWDALLCFAIAVYIGGSGFSKLLIEGGKVMLDQGMSAHQLKTIQSILNQFRDQGKIQGFHQLRTRRAGWKSYIQIHLEIAPQTPLIQAHQTADDIEKTLECLLAPVEVITHLDPHDDSDEDQRRQESIWGD